MNHAVSRRAVFALLPALWLSGCAGFGRNSPFWGTLRAGAQGGVGKAPAITRSYVDDLPYASMLVWFDGSPPALVVLAEVTTDQRWVWNSAERQAIIGFGPLITGLVGFDLELRGTMLRGDWDRNFLTMVGRQASRVLDVATEGQRIHVQLTSDFERGKPTHVEILERAHELILVKERVSAEGRRRFTNHYWIEEATGRCWKSEQTVIPTLPKLNIEMLKHPNA